MIVTKDKARCTAERLAIENSFLAENLILNTEEILKRKNEIKKLNEIYDFELIIQNPRKTFGFEVEIFDKDNDDVDIFYFIKNYILDNINKIKYYIKIGNFIYIKTKYNQIINTPQWCTPEYNLYQINPKLILKKNEKHLNDI